MQLTRGGGGVGEHACRRARATVYLLRRERIDTGPDPSIQLPERGGQAAEIFGRLSGREVDITRRGNRGLLCDRRERP